MFQRNFKVHDAKKNGYGVWEAKAFKQARDLYHNKEGFEKKIC